MKRISTILVAVMITAIGWAQSPEKMSYQAVIRDASNDLIATQAVGMQISILQGGSTGTPVYVETQTPTTDASGLVNLEIGTGTTSDEFSTIDWANNNYFIKIETDPIGGSSYTITGTTQLLSVPYALYAKTSGTSAGPMMYTVTGSDAITTSSTDKVQVAGMTMSPEPGTYIALFNAQLSGASVTTQSFGSSQGVADLETLYEELMDDAGQSRSNNVFGNGETLSPGVYNVSGAASTIGELIIDGGDTELNPLFIIRATTTFTAGATTLVELQGNAKSENIFWVAGTSASTAAGAQLKGTILAGGTGAGAVSTGADTVFEGRMLTKLGAITQGANTKLTAPTGAGVSSLGSLASFAMWSSAGAVSDVASSTTIGDVGNISGVLTITGDHTGEVYPKGTKQNDIVTVSPSAYSVSQNGIEVPGSARFFNIISGAVSIQAMITVTTENNPIDIKWNVETGEATLENRIFTLIRNEY